MSDERRAPGFLTEDLEPRIVDGPPRYTSRTDKPVEYIAIANQDDVLLGYCYANDEDGAVGWVARPEAGAEAYNRVYRWVMKLRDAKARGLSPTGALDEMARDGTDSPTDPWSHVVPGERRTAASVAALQELAEAPL